MVYYICCIFVFSYWILICIQWHKLLVVQKKKKTKTTPIYVLVVTNVH
jgi:hypothetical protein